MVITRRVEFSASHFCRVPELSDAENEALYGPATRTHGHNYVLEVALSGVPHPVNGMILDLKEMKEILNREVVSVYDHRHLNHEVPPFERVVPTAENIAIDIWRRLCGPLRERGATLDTVRLYETPDLWVEYRGDQ